MVERASSVQASQFTHHGHFYLADVTQDEQVKLSQILLSMIQDYYQKQFSGASAAISQSAMKTVSIAAFSEAAKAAQEAQPVAAAASGNLAVKNPNLQPSGPEVDAEVSLDPETINTKIRREIFKPELELDLSFNWRKKIDWTLVKAIALFVVACAIMIIFLTQLRNIDESSYKDHGRQYSDFFLRMSNPALRKSEPPADADNAPGTNSEKSSK
jgi:hypothetical protein